MVGKDGSTENNAHVAVDASPGEQVQPSRGAGTEGKSRPPPGMKAEPEPQQRTANMHQRHTSHDHRPSPGMIDRSLQAQIGRQLRAIFADVAEEPVPDRFIKLLEALEAREERR
jgi:hypothetical protein